MGKEESFTAQSGRDGAEQTFPTDGAVGDRESKVDTLGFEPYVQTFVEFLTNPETETPLTVSVEGDWGTGKSSFLAQLKKELDEQGYKTVGFDPWRHDTEGALWAAFALEFSRELRSEMSLRERLRGYWSLMKKRINPARIPVSSILKASFYVVALIVGAAFGVPLLLQSGLLGEVGIPDPQLTDVLLGSSGLFVAALSLFQLAGMTRRRVTSPITSRLRDAVEEPEYHSQLSFKSEFHNDIDRLVDAYVPKDEAVYVFIDDLDRCSVDKAAELTQALNMMTASKPRIVFILGLDREKVAAGIAANHEEMLPYLSDVDTQVSDSVADDDPSTRGKEFGFRYLEKFIQIPFQIPEPGQTDVRQFVAELMPEEAPPVEAVIPREGAADDGDDEETLATDDLLDLQHQATLDIVEMVAPALDNNPRAIKKFLNLFRLRSQLANQLGLLDVRDGEPTDGSLTLYQLGKFITISLRWPHLLPELDRDPYLLAELEQLAIREEQTSVPDGIRQWTTDIQLMKLLRRSTDGVIQPTDEDVPNPDPCSLQQVPIDTLLHISPRVDQPTDTTDGDIKAGENVIVFNIDPVNWELCRDGPTEEYEDVHGVENVGQPWHGIRKGSPDPTDNFSPGDLVIVRQTGGEGVRGIWTYHDTQPIKDQDEVPWKDDEYKLAIYCRPLIREFEPQINENEFMDQADYFQIQGAARSLNPKYAEQYLDAIASVLNDSDLEWEVETTDKDSVQHVIESMHQSATEAAPEG